MFEGIRLRKWSLTLILWTVPRAGLLVEIGNAYRIKGKRLRFCINFLWNFLWYLQLTLKICRATIALLVRGLAVKKDCWSGISPNGFYSTSFILRGGVFVSERAKRLLNYIFPAVGGMFATYLYNVVDGVFVGYTIIAALLMTVQ